jgi:three-Cys-motif partner protein
VTAHRFGGTWTEAKLEVLGDYLTAYTTALKGAPFLLHYVDAFAGTGVYRAKSKPGSEQAGSASIALATPGFARYTFMDKKLSHVRALRTLAQRHPHKRIDVHHGDANAIIDEFCREENWRGQRCVMFLDPYGLTVEWRTLECIRRTGAIDVWYLFPLNGLLRQMTHNPADRDGDKDRSLDRLLGTDSWRTELYAPEPTGDLFGADPLLRRTQELRVVLGWLTARLGELFPYVHEPAVLRMGNDRSRHGGPPLFALYFLMSNDRPKAVELAKRLVPGVIKGLRKSGTLA